MGFLHLNAKRVCQVSVVVLGLVFTVALFHGLSRTLEWGYGGGLLDKEKQDGTLRKLLMSMENGRHGGLGDSGAGIGDGVVGTFDGGVGSESGDDYGGVGSGDGGNGTMNQIGGTCSKDSISLNQGPSEPLPSGIPTYTVVVENVCPTGCSISNIHFSCAMFASARTINPHIFRRIGINDCLVNDGNPLTAGATLYFQYANTFAYPLKVSHLTCL